MRNRVHQQVDLLLLSEEERRSSAAKRVRPQLAARLVERQVAPGWRDEHDEVGSRWQVDADSDKFQAQAGRDWIELQIDPE